MGWANPNLCHGMFTADTIAGLRTFRECARWLAKEARRI